MVKRKRLQHNTSHHLGDGEIACSTTQHPPSLFIEGGGGHRLATYVAKFFWRGRNFWARICELRCAPVVFALRQRGNFPTLQRFWRGSVGVV